MSDLFLTLLTIPKQSKHKASPFFLTLRKLLIQSNGSTCTKVLDVFNFKQDFKRWVKVFYTDISSCVTNNGFASPFFNLKRGVRQGCPLSGLLFVLGIKLLNLAFQTNSNIKGIKVGDEEIKSTLFANDSTLLLRDLDSIQSSLETLENFKGCSVKLNQNQRSCGWAAGQQGMTHRSSFDGQKILFIML